MISISNVLSMIFTMRVRWIGVTYFAFNFYYGNALLSLFLCCVGPRYPGKAAESRGQTTKPFGGNVSYSSAGGKVGVRRDIADF